MAFDARCRVHCHDQMIVPSKGHAFTDFLASTHPLLPDSLYFLDDSGNADTSVFGFLRVPQVDGWSTADAAWTAFLEELQVNPYITYAPGFPLHAVDLVAGRGRLLHPVGGAAPTKRRKTEAANIVLQGLRTLARVPGLAVGAVYRHGATREDLYADLVEMVNNRHAAAGTSCQFIVDGNGTERGLRAAHRRLPVEYRHVLGDPLLVPARRIPLLQAADFVAYAAHQSVVRLPSRAFMWDWYTQVFPAANALIDLGSRLKRSGPLR
ncbi:DUF3800 domain-containing protein [Streptomyces poonensis]|uniref:DUF3800 domain-containing protein n=1 Tax=Streptomyces poonensis TaxID=68255 RepID=A0A918P7N2_9ACTN|nr:DUF3800 domain-containing protein [Streptomyces poonensis]GGY88490.1 hypothetical protein GCM10010365_03180 [Streptomyces poonensis]GLJ92376.1 hypothetical protein GCM10017589_49850 [Streptomyces poonensis]